MYKNNKKDFLGSDTIGYDKMRIQQMMPLPDDLTVMVVDTDDEDNVVMRDCAETAAAYCLVLVKDYAGQNYIYPYNLQVTGGIDVRGSVVPTRHCPGCGKRMHMTMEEGDEATLVYSCGCGYTEHGWKNDDVKEDKTNE